MSESKKKATKKKNSKKKSRKSTEMQVAKPKEVALSQSVDPTIAMIQVIERAAVNPDVDIDKMERLMNMQERMMDRNAEAEFNEAMTRAQALMPEVIKDAFNDHTKSGYAKHEQIAKMIKPTYTKEGFAITFTEEDSKRSDCIRISATLRHKAGHSEKYHTELPLDKAGINGTVNKTGIHATGSTITYGRRYLTCMIFDVATGDDTDGNVEAAEPVNYISEDQINKLDSKIRENKVNMKGFLTWMNKELKIKTIETIPDNFYDYVDKKIDTVIKNNS